jgi:hypothetical protein
MGTDDGTACIVIDDELKDIVPKKEVAKFVDRFRGKEECERAELQKIAQKPLDDGRVATCFAILKLLISAIFFQSVLTRPAKIYRS